MDGTYTRNVAIGATIATARTCASQRGTIGGFQMPATVYASSSSIAITSVRPSSTGKRVLKIGFSTIATSTAMASADRDARHR